MGIPSELLFYFFSRMCGNLRISFNWWQQFLKLFLNLSALKSCFRWKFLALTEQFSNLQECFAVARSKDRTWYGSNDVDCICVIYLRWVRCRFRKSVFIFFRTLDKSHKLSYSSIGGCKEKIRYRYYTNCILIFLE